MIFTRGIWYNWSILTHVWEDIFLPHKKSQERIQTGKHTLLYSFQVSDIAYKSMIVIRNQIIACMKYDVYIIPTLKTK